MRVLVFGGRDFSDRRWLFRVMDDLHARQPITCIIEGEASGADTLAREWAEDRGIEEIEVDPYPLTQSQIMENQRSAWETNALSEQ
jgi:hypothetical protein